MYLIRVAKDDPEISGKLISSDVLSDIPAKMKKKNQCLSIKF